MSANVQPLFGVIEGSNGEGPAWSRRYDVTVNFPGQSSKRFNGVESKAIVWPDNVTVMPPKPGRAVPVYLVGDRYQFLISPVAKVDPCDSQFVGDGDAGSALLSAVAAMTPEQRAALRALLLA